jgi:hypothetical protein
MQHNPSTVESSRKEIRIAKLLLTIERLRIRGVSCTKKYDYRSNESELQEEVSRMTQQYQAAQEEVSRSEIEKWRKFHECFGCKVDNDFSHKS